MSRSEDLLPARLRSLLADRLESAVKSRHGIRHDIDTQIPPLSDKGASHFYSVPVPGRPNLFGPYPTKVQVTWFVDMLERLRHLHNSARENRIHAYEAEGRSVSYIEQLKILTQACKNHEDFRAVPQELLCHRIFSTMHSVG